MIIVVTGGSSLPVDVLSKDLKKLFEDYGFGKVIINGNNGQEPCKGILRDESVEIDLTTFGV